jgi:hypothetical protein
VPTVPRIPAQGSLFTAFHQYAGFGVGAAMITLKMFYGTIPRKGVAEWTTFCVHVGLPCEIAEIAFGRFCGSIPAKHN